MKGISILGNSSDLRRQGLNFITQNFLLIRLQGVQRSYIVQEDVEKFSIKGQGNFYPFYPWFVRKSRFG